MLLDKSFGSKSVLIMYNPQSVNTQHTTHRKGKIDVKANCNHRSPRLCVCRFNQLLGLSLLNCSFRSESLHARAGALYSYFYGLSLRESCTFNAL